VREFTYSMGQPLDEKHGFSRKLEDMRWSLIKEEFAEVRDAVGYSEILKELADLVYVTYGYAATYGWDLDEAVRRVHKSNMSKLGVDGKPLKRPDGKVLKGPNYKKPDLTDLV
jgi:NTP pyrophosphatase (non-canonical NTP hydrolase)